LAYLSGEVDLSKPMWAFSSIAKTGIFSIQSI
jgi:hypothetical protein